MTERNPPRRRLSFTLKAILVVLGLLSIPLGLLGQRYQTYRRERQTASHFVGRPCQALFYDDSNFGHWLTPVFGENIFESCIYFEAGQGVSEADLARLHELSNIRAMYLGSPSITDQGLQNLRHHPSLQNLWLDGTSITEEGLRHLATIPHLQRLSVTASDQISASALEELKQKLPKLALVKPY